MRKLVLLIFFLGILGVSAFSSNQIVEAADIFSHTCSSGQLVSSTDVCHDVQGQASSKNNPIITILKAAINIISYALGAAGIIGIIVSGLRFIISSGDSNAVAAARTSIIYSLVGIAIAVSAQGIVVYVLDKV